MLTMMVTFNLNGMSEQEFRSLCEEQLAAPMAATPGLVSKTWLADPAANTYGGFYVWESQDAIERFAGSELFRGFASDPRIVNIQSHVFGVLEKPSRMTNGLGVVAV